MRGGPALSLLISFPICACAPRTEAPAPAAFALDCAQPFEIQSARVRAQPHMVAAPHESAEPYSFYSADDGRTSWLITEPGAPGHPAIMMQSAVGGAVKTAGCRYGSQKGYDQLMAYLDGLKTWRR